MKNVILIHGYNGIPNIFNYIKEELENRKFNVIIPKFPIREEITVEGYFNILDNYKEYYNNELIVIAHSLGNPMLVRYIAQNKFNIGIFISLAGFGQSFDMEGREDLNKVISKIKVSVEEKQNFKRLVNSRYSIYSDNDHVVPLELLKKFPEEIEANKLLIKGIGHMGNYSGLDKLPQVIEIIDKEDN